MKTHSFISKMLIIIFISLTSFIPVKNAKEKKVSKKAHVVLQCSCSIPTGPTATPSGSNVILSWDAVSGAICYSYGGSYNGGGGFSGNTGGTGTTVTIPSNGGWNLAGKGHLCRNLYQCYLQQCPHKFQHILIRLSNHAAG